MPAFGVRHIESMAAANVTFTSLGFRPVAESGGADAQRVFDRYVFKAPADDYTSVVRKKGKLVVEVASK